MTDDDYFLSTEATNYTKTYLFLSRNVNKIPCFLCALSNEQYQHTYVCVICVWLFGFERLGMEIR